MVRESSRSGGSSSKLSGAAKPTTKSLKPLSSFLAGGASSSGTSSRTAPAGTAALRTSSSSSSLSRPSHKKSKLSSGSAASANKQTDAIELSSSSSDDDVILEEEEEEEDGGSNGADSRSRAAGDSDNELVITGHSDAPPSSSFVKPRPPKKDASSTSNSTTSSRAPQRTAETRQNGNKALSPVVSKSNGSSGAISAKSKGKQRAADQDEDGTPTDGAADLMHALWSEKYAPRDLDSLCVHKKKVADVQKWLEEAFAGGVTSKYRRIMILSGGAGSGKTATIKVLSREMGIELLEYKTTEGNSESFINQFPSFLNKATVTSALAFGTLTADNKIIAPKAPQASTSASPPPIPANAFSTFKPVAHGGANPTKAKAKLPSAPAPTRRLILLEDLPNIFTSQPTRNAFRSALHAFSENKRLTSNLAPNANVPLVIIVSEALNRPGQNEGENAVLRYQGTSEQSVSVRSVVPAEVMRAPSSSEFKFNPVAVTFMKKALNSIVDREYARNPSQKPSQKAIQLVMEAADGDIRSALNTLQFVVGNKTAATSAELEAAAAAAGGSKKGKKRKSSGKVKESEDESANKALLHLVATKESSLFLFHALGKVLFNKRWGEKPDEDAKSTAVRPPDPPKLPKHLKHWDRRTSKVDSNALFSDAPVDSDMFMSYLHHNYPPFCDDIENTDHLMNYISVADSLMRMEGDNFTRHALTSHYSFQVSVRGGLLSLPSPVQRRGQKMYKSEMWECQRHERDNAHMIIDWIASITKERARIMDARSEADDSARGAGVGVDDDADLDADPEDGEDKDDEADIGELMPKKINLILEIIPFLGLMQAPQRTFTNASSAASANSSFRPNANSSASGSSHSFRGAAGVGGSSSNGFKLARPSSLGQPRLASAGVNLNKLPSALLDIAFMPPLQVASSGQALNEKDVPDSEEADEDDMKQKPSAPAVKVEKEEETEGGTSDPQASDESSLKQGEEPDVALDKLYLSDDDIDDF